MSNAIRSYAPDATTYYPTYQVQMGSTEVERNTLAAEQERGAVSLDEIREVCKLCDTNAQIRDVAGFSRGWVHDDGGYSLS